MILREAIIVSIAEWSPQYTSILGKLLEFAPFRFKHVLPFCKVFKCQEGAHSFQFSMFPPKRGRISPGKRFQWNGWGTLQLYQML